MQKHTEVTVQRVRRMLTQQLWPAIHHRTSPLEVGAFHVPGEPVGAAEAFAATYERFGVGREWGAAWTTTWFRLTGTVPAGWAGREVVARVHFGFARRPGYGGEGLVWMDGKPVQGVSRFHTDVSITPAATGGDPVELYVEAAANPATQMDWGPQMLLPSPEGPPLFRLSIADLACVDRRLAAFTYDYQILADLLDELPRTEPRWWEILTALNEACNELDPDDLSATVARAAPLLAGPLAMPSSPSAHRLSAVGHAHIDTAWLWPVRETIRKCARTFATALSLMDAYPEYRFVCSQAQQYAWMKERYPGLFERIRQKVGEGQWEPVGSMWVEPDCNVPSGESLVRQVVHGKLFFSEELGCETTDVWLPDAFGYSGALPQIMAQAGCRSFLSQKLSWNDTNEFPHHTFWWEGIDGTRVFTHFPPADTYNGRFTVAELVRGAQNFRDHARSGRSLYVYGHGDGGGGPTRDMLETARRARDLEGLPRLELEPAREFFRKAAEEARDLAVWQGELYLEFHRGTYTTQARTKLANRRSELWLREAELWSAACGPAEYPAAALDEAWKLTLLNQFHDVLPGSSIHWVYSDAERDYARVAELACGARDSAMQAIAADADTSDAEEPVVVFNALSHDRTEVVRLPAGAAPRGAQPVHEGVLRLVRVPSCGWTTVDAASPCEDPVEPVVVGERTMSNGLLRLEWDDEGLLVSVTDLVAGREVLAPGARGNVLQLHPDHPRNWDAWDVDPFYAERHEDLTGLDALEVVERGPLRGAVRLVRRFGSSTLTQTMRLSARARLVEFDTEVDWYETHRFLKVAFPVDVRSPRATYEIQFGHVERPTHTNTSWDLARFEVCGHTWADLSEPGYGVALLNDCKYGYDVRGNVLRLSLLRSPVWPDPEADRGLQRFSYALLPHAGDLRDGGVIQAAHAFNTPLRVVAARASPGDRPPEASVIRTDRPGVVVSAVKKAERSHSLVVRLYESFGGRGPVRLGFGMPVERAWRTDLLERDLEPVAVTDGHAELMLRPFEIVTLRLDVA